MTDYRPVGERRLWTFISSDTVLGTLESRVDESVTINGISGVRITEELSLDFGRAGHDYKVETEGDICVSDLGYYIGSDTRFIFDQHTEEMSLRRHAESIEGYSTHAGEKIDQSTSFKPDGYAASGYYVNRFELILAMRDIKVGDIIDEDVFIPADMMTSKIRGVVREYSWQRLYDQVHDSVFIVALDQPQQQVLFFTKEKRLVKVDYPVQRIRAYLDVVERPSVRAEAPRVPVSMVGFLLPVAFYLLIGLVAVFLLGGRGWRRSIVYTAFGIGVIGYFAARVTQVPLQDYLVETVLIPELNRGGSLFVWGLLPALAGGLIQELLILGGIIGVSTTIKRRKHDHIITAPFLGVGFGSCEAGFLAVGLQPSLLTFWVLIERASFIFFHAASASLLSRSFGRDRDGLGTTLFVLIMANSLLRYLPAFVHEKVVPVEVVYAAVALIALIVVTWATFRRRQTDF